MFVLHIHSDFIYNVIAYSFGIGYSLFFSRIWKSTGTDFVFNKLLPHIHERWWNSSYFGLSTVNQELVPFNKSWYENSGIFCIDENSKVILATI
jgi:hypothetical protein